jgi:GNAT superfamily N-acetyltransferase
MLEASTVFDDTRTVRRIEDAEAALTRDVTRAVIASGRAPRAFVRELGPGLGSYIRPSSPMNKVIGVDPAGALDDGALARFEALMRACHEPTRIELALGSAETDARLLGRGYQLLGFEHVLVRSLHTSFERAPAAARIQRVTADTVALWKQTSIDAAAASDETGLPVDRFSYDIVAQAIEDFLEAPGFDRHLAFLDGTPAGAGSMRLHARIALFSGSATRPAWRRRGVQAALIATRLAEARERGAELAVVTTAPGSQSEANMMKWGFSLAYARAIWVRP